MVQISYHREKGSGSLTAAEVETTNIQLGFCLQLKAVFLSIQGEKRKLEKLKI